MKVKIIIESQKLSKEEFRSLLQAIHSCEQESFPDKKISILIDTQGLPATEAAEIISSIKPCYVTWIL